MYRRSNTQRRFNSFRSRGFGARRGPRLRYPKETVRWETSDFFFDSGTGVTFPSGSAAESKQYFHIASPSISLGGANNTGGIGQLLPDIARSINIGGIVFDYGLEVTGTIQPGDAADGDQGRHGFWEHWALISDRMVTEITEPTNIFPNSVNNWSPFTSGFPVSVLSGTTPQDEVNDVNRPTRIHWTRTYYRNFGARIILASDQPFEGALYVPNEQLLAPRRAPVNKRLRLVLPDGFGLFLVNSTRNNSAFEGNTGDRRIYRWVRGTVYYRVKF